MKQFRIFLLVAFIYLIGLAHGLTLRAPQAGSTPTAWREVQDKPVPLQFAVCPACGRPIPQNTKREWHGRARDIDWETR
jgi:hypothetical protein